MKQDHRPWDMHTSKGGANTDAEAEDVARSHSRYINAQNMRLASQKGNDGDADKIAGEIIIHGPDGPGASTCVCIGAHQVKQWKVTIWASTTPDIIPPFIQVDGVTMVQHPSLPYVYDKKLQLHSAWQCGGGLLFDARSGGIPLHWDIGDIVRAFNANEQTYFSALNIAAYQVNPTRQVNRPVFKGLTVVGGGSGVKPGRIFYTTRYVNENGDRTPQSPPVGPVDVPVTNTVGGGGVTPAMPSAGIAGANPGQVGTPTGFGISLVVRSNNVANFQSLELIATEYNLNGGPDAIPAIRIALRVPVQPGENVPIPLEDIGESLEEIPGDEDSLKVSFIKEANSVRYVGYRVWYGGVKLGKSDVTAEVVAGDPTLFPFTKNIGIKGHSDPVNNCYYRRFMSNEKHGVGVVYLDSSGGDTFVQPLGEITLPSRRDEKSGISLSQSDAPCYAANVFNEVTPTFEVFDHDQATGRTQTGQVVNVMIDGTRRANAALFPNQAVVPSGITPSQVFVPYGANNDGVYYDSVGLKTSYAKPLRPVAPADIQAGKFGLDYRVNTAVRREGTPDAPTQIPYDPKVFNVTHHTLGIGFRGLVSAPAGMQGFSLVATKPAQRVIGQALFKWKITNASGVNDQPSKEAGQGILCIPDFNAGVLNQEHYEGLQNSPNLYKFQFVSPLGFATDQFGSVMAQVSPAAGGPLLPPSYDNAAGVSAIADLLSYARILWDTGQINPGNDSGGSTPTNPLPGNPDHFVNFGSWRGTQDAGPWAVPEGGNRLIPLLSATELLHTAGMRSLICNMGVPIYQTTVTAGVTDFGHSNAEDFHEPWYVVNIIQEGATVDTVAGYCAHNHYQAFVSVIGTTSGISNESFVLVDENQDLISNAADGIERYIWIMTPSGPQPWLNSTPFWLQLPAIQASIASLGYWDTPAGVRIYGTFNLQVVGSTGDVVVQLNGTPPAGSTVEVRYRFGADAIPSKMYGDIITSPALATMVDTVATANPSGSIGISEQVAAPGARWPMYRPDWFSLGAQVLRTNGLPIPFANYRYNDRYLVPFGRGWGASPSGLYSVNQFAHGMIVSVRQWKVLFDCEVRAPLYLAMHEPVSYGNKAWPQTHYVQRPFNFIIGGDLLQNGVHSNYNDPLLYPSESSSEWQYGGIKGLQVPLGDYCVQPRVMYFKKPEFGFTEEEEQCNLLVWSEKDNPLLQDSPGLKTFPVLNREFIENDTGKIQRLFSCDGNIQGVTEGGCFEVMVEKSVAYSADGEAFSMYAQTNAVGRVNFRSKEVGMPGKTWETAAEGAPEIGGVRRDALIWSDLVSAYALGSGGPPVDIGEGYRKEIRSAFVSMQSDFFSAFYDGKKDEYGFGTSRLQIETVNNGALVTRVIPGKVLVYGFNKDVRAWMGAFTYVHDDYQYFNGRLYGMRRRTTYRLDEGTLLGGNPVAGWIHIPSAPNPGERMEWMRIKVNSPRKPTAVEFYDENGTLVSRIDAPFAVSLGQPDWTYMKKVTNWEAMVPRNRFTNRDRLQGRVASYRIIFGAEGEDKLIFSATQVKSLV